MIILAHVSDLHVNSTVALSPNKLVLDDGHEFRPSKLQRWINGKWADYWQRVDELKAQHQAEVVTIINGEVADNNYHATTQLITKHTGDQISAALMVLEPLRAVSDRIIVTRGTEAHVGPNATLDEAVAGIIGAVPNPDTGTDSWWRWHGVLEGVRIDATHHPISGGTRGWTMGGGAVRTAMQVAHEYHIREMLPPHLILRGHRHRPEDSGTNVPFSRCVINPAWQAGTSFGSKLGGDYLPIGGRIFGLSKGRIVLDEAHHHYPRIKPWRETK